MSEKEQTRINELIARIKSDDDKEAGTAAFELCKIGKPAVPALIPLLSDHDQKKIFRAALTLRAIGPDASDAIPHFVSLLDHKDDKIQIVGAVTLAKVNPIDKKALSILHSSLQSKDKEIRVIAADSIGACGEVAKDFIPDLMKSVHDKDKSVRNSAMKAVLSIDDEEEKNLRGTEVTCRICQIIAGYEYCYYSNYCNNM